MSVLFLQGVNRIVAARVTSGTSIDLGGDFALSLGGSRSQYLPSDASARDVKLALEAMDTVGTVDVERNDGDEQVRPNRTTTFLGDFHEQISANLSAGPSVNDSPSVVEVDRQSKTRVVPCRHVWFSPQVYGGYTWIVTFNTDLGDVESLTADIMSMTGTAPVLAVSENVKGVAPSFSSLDPYNSLPLGSATLTDLSDLSMNVAGLEEGVSYYFRVTASNYIGSGTLLCCTLPS